MKRPSPLAVLALAGLLTGCAQAPQAPAAVQATRLAAQGAAAGWVVTASSVEALRGRVDAVSPPVPTPPGAAALLGAASCLGPAGPLGAYGPLGTLGPLGSNAWNASRYLDLVGGWQGWADQLTRHGGPLSGQGPLGPQGPLGTSYTTVMPKVSDFAAHLAAGGLWTALGPVGPLGALGPLGPLGPLGAHGFKRDGLGRYVDGEGRVQRQVQVPWGAGHRRYELVERYPGDTASQLDDNDTSFLAEGALDGQAEVDRYPLTSREAQYVTFTLVPEKQLDDFDLEVVDARGERIARSDSRGLIDFVQLRARAGERLEVRVSRRAHAHVLRATYRLVVVGSTRHVPLSTLAGPHQLPR